MQRIARFEKVTFEQFKSGYVKCLGDAAEDGIRQVYERIRLKGRRAGQPVMIFIRPPRSPLLRAKASGSRRGSAV